MTAPTVAPSRPELTDALAVFVLIAIGIVGYRNAYGGTAYLALGALGALLGLTLAHFAGRSSRPVVAAVIGSVILAVLLAGVVLRDTAVAGVLPSGRSVIELARSVVVGWKDLLTTVRPVGNARHLLALPYVVALTAAVTSAVLARRSRHLALPLVPPVLVVALSILFGGSTPAAAFLQGCVFAGVSLAWIAVRAGRGRISLTRSSQRLFRPIAGLTVLLVAIGGAWVVGPHVPLANARDRTIAKIQPPFDPGAYASPLGEFRRYTKNAPRSVVGKVLFQVSGAPSGTEVRMATLDAYDGLVWAASNQASTLSPVAGFAHVGSRLPSSGSGAVRTAAVGIGPGEDGQPWLPTIGLPQAVSFDGPRADQLTDDLRYNLATSTGLVPQRLRQGDRVSLLYRATKPLTAKELAATEPDGAPTMQPAAYESLRASATKLAEGTSRPMDRVLAIARKLHGGAYSDGKDSVPSDPGHGVGRLASFVQAREFVGNDEQYAAAMALMANAVGVPARVVLYGVVEKDGSVMGRDVRAGVELALAGLGWTALPIDTFTPPRDKRPRVQPLSQLPEIPPKLVPPPLHSLLSSTSAATDAQTSDQKPRKRAAKKHGAAAGLPTPIVLTAKYGGPPAGLVALFAAVVLGLKALRRRRRRRSGSASKRVVSAWAEVLDVVRDLGVHVHPHGTRREQAEALAPLPLQPLAHGADAAVFGPGAVEDHHVSAYWDSALAARKQLLSELSLWRRIRTVLSLRSLRPGHARPTAPVGAS